MYRAQVLTKIREASQKRGVQFKEVTYSNFWRSLEERSLFGEMCVLIDVNKAIKEVSDFPNAFIKLGSKISSRGLANRVVLVVQREQAVLNFLDMPEFKTLAKHCLYLEEPLPTKVNFPKILENLVATSSIMNASAIRNLEILKTTFWEMVSAQDLKLPEIVSKFELCLILCVNQELMLFDPQIFRVWVYRDSKKVYFKLHKVVSDFLVSFRDRDRNMLFKEVEHQLIMEQREPKQILFALFGVVKDLISATQASRISNADDMGEQTYKERMIQQFKHVPMQGILKFMVKLSEWEPKLNSGNFLLEFNSLLEGLVGSSVK